MGKWTRDIPPERRYVDAILRIDHHGDDGYDRVFNFEIVPPLNGPPARDRVVNIQVRLTNSTRTSNAGINLDYEEIEQLRDICNEFLMYHDKLFNELREKLVKERAGG